MAGTNGYNLRGSVQHRLSKTRTIGATYEHIHFDFPPSYGQSDINLVEASFNTTIGRRLNFGVSGGAFQAEVQGIQQVTLSPVIAALLGTSVGAQSFYTKTTSPSGSVHLSEKFRTSSLGIQGGQTIAPGNGIFLTSKSTSASLYYSYTGIRKWNFGLTAGYNRLDAVGQGLSQYSGFTDGAGFTYSLTHAIQVVGRYDGRRNSINGVNYQQSGSRVTIGLAFSPANIPLSLW